MAKPEYRRINCGIFLNPEEHPVINGTMTFHPEFINRYNDYKQWFEDVFEQMLVDNFGEEGWAVFFVQVTQHEPSFFADIYLDKQSDYPRMAMYVHNTLVAKGFKSTPFLRGTIQDYIGGQ